MTVETPVSKVSANGNGVTTVFSFSPMVIYASTELAVYKRDANGVETLLVEGGGTSDYTVTVSSYPGTGSITFPSSGSTELATGETIVMLRVPELSQETDLENQGGYFPEVQETQFDKLVMIDMYQQNQLDRSLKIAVSDPAVSYDLTVPPLEAGFVLGNDGTSLVWLTGLTSAATVSAYMATVVTAASEAVFKATVNLEIGVDVQAFDADLSAIAALTSAANKLPYATGAQAWALTDLSAAGRALIDDADNAAQRTTLGFNQTVLQRVRATVNSVGSTAVAVPNDNTIPQQSGPEGAQIVAVTITPKLSTSFLRVRAGGMFSQSVGSGSHATLVLYRDSTANAIQALRFQHSGVNDQRLGYIECVVAAGSVSATTLKFFAGPANAADTLRWGGDSGTGTLYGGVAETWIEVEEFTV